MSKVYDNIFVDSTLYPHRWDIIFRSIWRYFPPSVLYYLRYLPSREYSRFRGYQDFIREFARDLIKKSEASSDGKDIMNTLLRANASEEKSLKLSEAEVVDQISTLLFAGHDTVAVSMTWWLWELAKSPGWQSRVREEIRSTRAKVAGRGETEFSVNDLDDMPLMNATLKEALRLHPIVLHLEREAGQDDVIPLAHPIVTQSGDLISEIPVEKGQAIDIPIAACNRNPDIWGQDADHWNPERFLATERLQKASVGVYANLLNFSAGIRACLGWRFAVIEMQTIAATLLENFEFELPPQTAGNVIKRRPTAVMAPMADGHPGIWMGLRVKNAT